MPSKCWKQKKAVDFLLTCYWLIPLQGMTDPWQGRQGKRKEQGSCRLGDLTVFLHSCFPGSTDIPKASIRRPKFQKIKSPNCKISSLVFRTFVQARKKTLNPHLTVSVKEAQAYAYSPVFEIESFSDLIILRMALSRVVIVFIRL